ncbi:MAG TPA: N-methyl-L-tryptophan oxidase [Pyrinomonadaceae bacterium]|nr:N-methyl-L-tryptophan oxidase [Pyrinomonadaceae bacterium]
MVSKTYDVAVIGAGVFGAWTAYQLQRSGRRVLLIDAYGAGNSRSSSGDESRIIRMGYGGDEIYTRSAQRSLELWKELFARTGQPLFHQTGVLWLAHDEDPYPVNSLETITNLGIAVEKLTAEETRDRFPQINLDNISWTMFEPGSGVLVARRAVQAVVSAAISAGAEYLQEEIEPPDGEDIRTASGQGISAGTYVFACGAWLPKLFPELLSDRIHPTRQEVFYFGAHGGDRFKPPKLPVWIDFKDEAYGLPDVESRGVKVAIDRHGAAFDPDTGNRIASAEGLTEARAYLARRIPELRDAPVTETRVCQYENTSNGDFLIDRHPQMDNVWLVGGGSGHGFKHGPFVGEYATASIEGQAKGIEPRFSLATKMNERKRAVY